MSVKNSARRKRLRRDGSPRVILGAAVIALCLWGGVTLPAVAETVNVLRPIARGAVSDPAPATAPTAPPIEPAPALTGEDGGSKPDLTTAAPITLYDVSPPARSAVIPRTRWQHRRGHAIWTRTALSALKSHGKPLVDMVPADVEEWCPAYPTASDADRRAFWVGFMSALAKHESTYKARAVGGGGLWYGLLQILPATARGYGCNAGTGASLQNGGANLSCAIRIMAVTVPRDGVIYGRGGKGVGADWGPMRSPAKRNDMAGWLKRQTYCKPLDAVRPKARP